MTERAGRLRVRREQPERASARAAERAEVALIERQEVADPVSIGEDHQRRVGETDLEGRVLRDEPFRGRDQLRGLTTITNTRKAIRNISAKVA